MCSFCFLFCSFILVAQIGLDGLTGLERKKKKQKKNRPREEGKLQERWTIRTKIKGKEISSGNLMGSLLLYIYVDGWMQQQQEFFCYCIRESVWPCLLTPGRLEWCGREEEKRRRARPWCKVFLLVLDGGKKAFGPFIHHHWCSTIIDRLLSGLVRCSNRLID